MAAWGHIGVTTQNTPSPTLERVVRAPAAPLLHALLARRHSPRAIAGGRVPPATLQRLLEAARWAPSSGNGQPWAFVIVRREDAEAHAAVADLLLNRNRLWAPKASLLIAALARTTRADGTHHPTALYDLGLAVSQLVLQATAEGLATHQMGGFDRARARDVLAVPEGWEPVVLIAVGTFDSPENLPDELRALDTAPRTRLPLGDIVFMRRFGTPLESEPPSS